MNRFRFSIAGLLIMTAIVAVGVNSVAVYFGWQYPRKVRRTMSFVDSLEDSVSSEEFIAELKLGEMQEYPPMGGGDLSELSGYWEFNHGYRVDVDFGPDEMLVYAMIWADSNNHSFYLWGWIRGDRKTKDVFEKQMQRLKRP